MSFGLRRTVDPFYEEPFPKAFYHPSSNLNVSYNNKNHMSPDRIRNGRPDPKPQLTPEEEAFLRGSYHYEKPHKLPTNDQTMKGQGNHEDNSSKFDESWPGSERPSTLSLLDSPTLEEIMKSTKYHGRMSTIVSQPSDSISPVATLDGIKSRLDFAGVEKDDTRKGHVSTLSKYIERFRMGQPLSRDERDQHKLTNQKDFWWLNHTSSSIVTPPSSSTPKEGEEPHGRGGAKTKTCSRLDRDSQRVGSYSRTSQLTRTNLESSGLTRGDHNPWGMDEQSRILQERADQLLEKTSSTLHSSEPAVSTDGLGHSSPDTTVTEHSYRPAFTHVIDLSKYRRNKKPTNKEDDILYQWRFKRKMEVAKSKLTGVVSSSTGPGKGQVVSDKEINSKLAEFRQRLAGGSTVQRPNFTPAPAISGEPAQTASVPIASPYLTRAAQCGGSGHLVPHLHLQADILPDEGSHGNQADIHSNNVSSRGPGNQDGDLVHKHNILDHIAKQQSGKGAQNSFHKNNSQQIAVDEQNDKQVVTNINQKISRPGCDLSNLDHVNNVTDSSFEEMKSQHLRSLKSEDGIEGDLRSNPDSVRYDREMIPVKDVGLDYVIQRTEGQTSRSQEGQSSRKAQHEGPRSQEGKHEGQRSQEGKHEGQKYQQSKHKHQRPQEGQRSQEGHRSQQDKPRSQDHMERITSDNKSIMRTDPDSDSLLSLTEVSDMEDVHLPVNRQKKRTKISNHSKYSDSDRSISSMRKQSSQRENGHDSHISTQPRKPSKQNSSEDSDVKARHVHSRCRTKHDPDDPKSRQGQRYKKTVPQPQDHSSPVHLLKSTIDQVVQDRLLSSSVSSESDPGQQSNKDTLLEDDQSHRSKVISSVTLTVTKETQDGPIRFIQLGAETITLSDGEEFQDDDLLQDLRRRRQHFLHQLAQMDASHVADSNII